MNRRQFAIGMAACAGELILDRSVEASTRLFDPGVQADLSPTYAESVQLAGMTSDGAREISFRVARFPRLVRVKTVEFDPIAARRRFRVGLENGRVIEGEAVTQRTISTPIEGRRRPSTTVMVKSDIGPMVGNLNDWEPDKQ